MLDTIQSIFTNTISENRDNPNFLVIVRDTTFELAHKKLVQLKSNEHFQARLDRLLIIFVSSLNKEGVKNPKTISSVIDGLIKAASYESEQGLYQTIYQKERLEKSIEEQKHKIKELITNSYLTVEDAVKELDEEDRGIVLLSIKDAQLKGIEMFGILKETAEEAYLRTIEKGEDIEDTITEITKNFTYYAINEGKFTKKRVLDIASNLIDVAIDIADTDYSWAKEVLSGAVKGTKNGIYKAVEKFKNDLSHAPIEAEDFLGTTLEEGRREFIKMEESFLVMLKQEQLHSTGISSEILGEIIAEEDTSYARLKRISIETSEAISDRLESLTEDAKERFGEFKKEASIKAQVFKEESAPKAKQAAQDAKQLGLRAWEVAKKMMDNAVHSAKEAMHKEDKDKK